MLRLPAAMHTAEGSLRLGLFASGVKTLAITQRFWLCSSARAELNPGRSLTLIIPDRWVTVAPALARPGS